MTDRRASSHYERLSFLDNTFLALEGPGNPMHVGATLVFEGGPLVDELGAVDIDAVRAFIGARLQYAPRYRQRLEWIPVERHPVWVDDAHFDIDFHVQHAALPHPGDEEALAEMAGRFMSQRLDRAKPLWEVMVVEGLQEGRFALLSKVHHCMIDGIGGVDLMRVLLSPSPEDEPGEADRFEPRPAPSRAQLFADEVARRMKAPADAARSLRKFVDETRELSEEVRHRLLAMTHTARSGWFSNASETPINGRIGPNRRIAWLVTDLDEVKAVKNALGGTVNDVVIAAVAGAVRTFLTEHRDFDVEGLDFRAMVPVSTRGTGADSGTGSNHVTMWLLDLPVGLESAADRLSAVSDATEHLKVSEQALGASLLTQSVSFTPSTVLGVAARVVAATARPFNMTITNVPGPQLPLFLYGAQLRRIFPMVPLWVNHGLGVALFSYDGELNWGLGADRDLVPDLDRFVECIRSALDDLSAAAKEAAAT